MNKKKIGIIGHFAVGKNYLDGQTIKTKILYESLKEKKLFRSIKIVDTYNWKKNPLALMFNTIFAMLTCSNVIVLLSQNGMKVFFPSLYYLNIIFKKKIHHVVIGGNLVELMKRNSSWEKYLNAFEGNYVETHSLQENLKVLGVNNVLVLTNFKKLPVIEEKVLFDEYNEPFKLCTFSRVMKEKGIEDAINAVKKINNEAERIIYTLDIYGQVDNNYVDAFNNIIKNAPDFIQYKGIVPFDKSVNVLKNYFMLLFLTYFDGEGFPGTLIDAFASGLPVIASDWHYNREIIQNDKTGKIVPVHDIDALIDVLKCYSENSQQVLDMKKNCIREAYKYMPDYALLPLLEHLI
ncbi:glycosyltransferase [Phosphitispora sp. TUW77]|uniref:glycosyltransferase n=1 Tax=Phosphitispora sp. TUW77 TaxID=3152361 RepID=UPI003AB80206